MLKNDMIDGIEYHFRKQGKRLTNLRKVPMSKLEEMIKKYNVNIVDEVNELKLEKEKDEAERIRKHEVYKQECEERERLLDEKNKLVYELNKQKYLVMDNYDRDEKVDIVLQRAGISLENKGTSSSLSVWYKDIDNTIVSRNIIPYSYVTEKKYYKGLS